jgi:arylsulfatase A
VPLLANWKGTTPAGRVSTDLIDSTDFLPTLIEAVRHKLPAGAAMDGRSFLPQLRGEKGRPREWLYMHHDPRPGWDKDRFRLERFARTQRFKLYDDGRLFDLSTDVLEEKPIMPGADTKISAAARARLQKVLDSHKPFPVFTPDKTP